MFLDNRVVHEHRLCFLYMNSRNASTNFSCIQSHWQGGMIKQKCFILEAMYLNINTGPCFIETESFEFVRDAHQSSEKSYFG